MQAAIEDATGRLVEAGRREQEQLIGALTELRSVGKLAVLSIVRRSRRVQGMRLAMQHQCELMQLRIAKTFGLDRLHRRCDIVAVGAGLAVALEHVAVADRASDRRPAYWTWPRSTT